MRRDVAALAAVAAAVAAGKICVAAPANTAVVLEAKDEGSLNVGGARATIDGAQVVDKLDGTAIPVSPGAHRAVFAAPGFRSIETDFVVAQGQKLRVVVFLTAAPGSVLMLAAPGQRDEPPTVGNRQRTLGLVLAGVGLGGLAISTIWSLKSKSTYDDALTFECGGDPKRCSEQGIADGKTAHREATIATIGFAAAGVLLAAGVTLYVTGRKQTGLAVAPTSEGGGSLLLAGAW